MPDEALYREMRLNYRDYFTGRHGRRVRARSAGRHGPGRDGLTELRDVIANGKGQKRAKAIKRLKVVSTRS